MKTIMILGGGPNQLPLLKAAKKREYQVVLCDYNTENPGREYADIFHCISTLDQDAVIDAALAQKIDGIITNSEPAMKIAAYTAQKLGLPCNPPEIIEALSRKDKFRTLLRNKGFPVPGVRYADNESEARAALMSLRLPVMVKPVDSSGSRGVTKLMDMAELPKAFTYAMAFSRMKRVILEEFIENAHQYMIGGDIFVLNGQVIFCGLMDCIRDNEVNPFVPVGKQYPATLSSRERIDISCMLQKMLTSFGIKFGAFNMEMIISVDGNIYCIEMNPRNGGNYIPELLLQETGFNIYDATVATATGDTNILYAKQHQDCFFASYIVHSTRNGILLSVDFAQELVPSIVNYFEICRPGEPVERFNNADKLIGILFLHFDNRVQMEKQLLQINDLVTVEVVANA